uniref:Laminin G domain-containing protein n=1 Tax=Podarcis muralis TaxID=64176 RepID=A0A670J0U2_PODMU
GVIFYGDMSPGVNWFLLALRNGKPEIQIHNTLTNVTVSGGRRLDDGHWHRVRGVCNEGHTVLLAVDGVDQLTLNHVSEAIVEAPVFALRIGVGGLLIPMEELLLPLNPAMDGCMRRWNWLNKSTEWPLPISAYKSSFLHCDTHPPIPFHFYSVAGQEKFPAAQERSFFRGCLRGVRVQGHELDFDEVQSRSNAIWPHSCPGADVGQAKADQEE